MCVIIHKPAGVALPFPLLGAAAALNQDGWGVMGVDGDGQVVVERHARLNLADLQAMATRLQSGEATFHLRLRTRGRVEEANTHPFPVADELFLMHNGTLGNLACGGAGLSDTGTFVRDILSPLAGRHPEVVADPALHRLWELALGPDNRMVLFDARARQTIILNRRAGADYQGLWLSNTRWVDARVLRLETPAQPQERTYAADHLLFG